MATGAFALTPHTAITAVPTLPQAIVARQDNSKSLAFPACRDNADGPCKLMESSTAACRRLFASVTGLAPTMHQEYYCRCTNGYFQQSSSCMIDCYFRTARDWASVSRDSRIVELDCESHSIAISDELIFNSKTIFVANTTGTASRSTSSLQKDPGASVGATASANVEETAAWVDRPSATGSSQQSVGLKNIAMLEWTSWRLITIALAMSASFLA